MKEQKITFAATIKRVEYCANPLTDGKTDCWVRLMISEEETRLLIKKYPDADLTNKRYVRRRQDLRAQTSTFYADSLNIIDGLIFYADDIAPALKRGQKVVIFCRIADMPHYPRGTVLLNITNLHEV